MLKWNFLKWDCVAWTGLRWFWIGTGSGCFECGHEPSGSIKWGNFLTSFYISQEGRCSVELVD